MARRLPHCLDKGIISLFTMLDEAKEIMESNYKENDSRIFTNFVPYLPAFSPGGSLQTPDLATVEVVKMRPFFLGLIRPFERSEAGGLGGTPRKEVAPRLKQGLR